ncbi:GerAB/ArcD/ProY family transporter [Fictibacillus phosphorivorans]|uniref:GerAB/ArcD/ProY family transporter n=1 Tax=Fictibacillus phosphorivorans TaxID=1221500 RepID=UPI00203E653B|nr:GerAB/ArcD/ProY family transporter [Fictibacillus phosphorivorans]MCM3718666.1 spore germination protein [Fictibacillus phosphorivorans]MCM3776289.1 spore germination protein [Fictibacillus phosphorivorans]
MNSHTITHRQLFFLVIQTQIGVGVLSLPYTLFSKAKIDGWISLFMAGIFIQFSVLAIWKLCDRFPKQTIYEILPKIMGKKLGYVFNAIYTIHFSFISILILIMYNSIVGKWILFETPHWVIIFIMAAVGYYVITSSPREIVRFFVLVTPLLIILFILILYAYTDVHLLYLFPVGHTGILTIIKSSADAVVALLGFDAALVFLAYSNASAARNIKVISFASFCITILYGFIVFTTYIFFNPKEIIIVPEPVLYMLKAFSFSIIERTDLIFLSVWIISVATSFVCYLFIAAKGVQTLFGLKEHQKGAPYIAIFCAVIAIIPDDKLEVMTWNKYITMTSVFLSAVFPIVLLVIAVLRKKQEKGAATS